MTSLKLHTCWMLRNTWAGLGGWVGWVVMTSFKLHTCWMLRNTWARLGAWVGGVMTSLKSRTCWMLRNTRGWGGWVGWGVMTSLKLHTCWMLRNTWVGLHGWVGWVVMTSLKLHTCWMLRNSWLGLGGWVGWVVMTSLKLHTCWMLCNTWGWGGWVGSGVMTSLKLRTCWMLRNTWGWGGWVGWGVMTSLKSRTCWVLRNTWAWGGWVGWGAMTSLKLHTCWMFLCSFLCLVNIAVLTFFGISFARTMDQANEGEWRWMKQNVAHTFGEWRWMKQTWHFVRYSVVSCTHRNVFHWHRGCFQVPGDSGAMNSILLSLTHLILVRAIGIPLPPVAHDWQQYDIQDLLHLRHVMLRAAMWQDHSAQQCLSVLRMALLCQTHSAVTCGNFVSGTSLECAFIWTSWTRFFSWCRSLPTMVISVPAGVRFGVRHPGCCGGTCC